MSGLVTCALSVVKETISTEEAPVCFVKVVVGVFVGVDGIAGCACAPWVVDVTVGVIVDVDVGVGVVVGVDVKVDVGEGD